MASKKLKNSYNKKNVSNQITSNDDLISKIHCENEDSRKSVAALAEILLESERGRELLSFAIEKNVTIDMADGIRAKGSFNTEKNCIVLSQRQPFMLLVSVLAHELRHAEQFNTNIDLNSAKYTTQSYLGGMFAIEADATANQALCCWQLKQKGYDKPWQEFETEKPEIAKSFAEHAKNENIGKALEGAFLAWFGDIYVRSLYEKNYSKMLEQAKDKQSITPVTLDKKLSAKETIQRTCVYGDKNYFSKDANIIYSKDFLSMNDENWWSCYRAIRDTFPRGNDWSYEKSGEYAKEKLQKLPVRLGDKYSGFSYEYRKPEKSNLALVASKKNNHR